MQLTVMHSKRALKDEKVPTQTILLGEEFQCLRTREKKLN